MKKPKKWYEVYACGTTAGDEEAKFFKALARSPQYDYRSTAAIAKETGLGRQRIEEIIDKFASSSKYNPPLVYPHPSNEDHWGYWERCPDQIPDLDQGTIAEKNQKGRIKEHLGDVYFTSTIQSGTVDKNKNLYPLDLLRLDPDDVVDKQQDALAPDNFWPSDLFENMGQELVPGNFWQSNTFEAVFHTFAMSQQDVNFLYYSH